MDRFTTTDMVASIHILHTIQQPTDLAEPLPPAPQILPDPLQPPSIRPDMVSPPTSGSPTPVPLGVGGLPGYV